MYNFKMTKERSNEILENCNFNDFEKKLFNSLISTRTRKEVYKQFEYSQPTIDREIKKLAKRIDEYDNKKGMNTLKLYMHIFPNNKKYIGICQCCEDRWANGNGYGYNKDMFEDIKKYGWENIEHIILLESYNNELICQLESNLIKALKLYDFENGYNGEYGLTRK